MSTADIAKHLKITQTRVIEMAGKGQWQRNRSEVAKRENAALVRMQEIEKVSLVMQARVLSEHRSDIKSMRAVATNLWAELESQTEDEESLANRVKTFEKLVSSSKTLILLERQSHGIESAIQDPEAKFENRTPAEDAMQALSNAFAAVLTKSTTPQDAPTLKDMGAVVEVTP